MDRLRDVTRADFEEVSRLLALAGRPGITARNREDAQKVFWDHVDRDLSFSQLAIREGVVIGFIALELRYRLNYISWEG